MLGESALTIVTALALDELRATGRGIGQRLQDLN